MTELDPYGYLSAPLDGLWMRAPYLHNGSGPTVRDLSIRVSRIGPRGMLEQLDSFATRANNGNGNGGQLYGSTLPPEQKEQLIEYLKTLRAGASRHPPCHLARVKLRIASR